MVGRSFREGGASVVPQRTCKSRMFLLTIQAGQIRRSEGNRRRRTIDWPQESPGGTKTRRAKNGAHVMRSRHVPVLQFLTASWQFILPRLAVTQPSSLMRTEHRIGFVCDSSQLYPYSVQHGREEGKALEAPCMSTFPHSFPPSSPFGPEVRNPQT